MTGKLFTVRMQSVEMATAWIGSVKRLLFEKIHQRSLTVTKLLLSGRGFQVPLYSNLNVKALVK